MVTLTLNTQTCGWSFSLKAHLQSSLKEFTSISEPSDWMILTTTTMGMQIIEAKARHQPTPTDQSGYLYILLYVSGLYFTSENTKQPWNTKERGGGEEKSLECIPWLDLTHTVQTYHTQHRGNQHPAPFHPTVRSVANHLLNSIVEIISACSQSHTHLYIHICPIALSSS